MDYPNLQRLRDTNEKAANEMVASIARGVHAGNVDMVPQAAAKKAVETAEEVLKLMASDTEVELLLKDFTSNDEVELLLKDFTSNDVELLLNDLREVRDRVEDHVSGRVVGIVGEAIDAIIVLSQRK